MSQPSHNIDTHCGACRARIVDVSHATGDRPTVRICPACDGASLLPQPSDAELGLEYANYYRRRGGGAPGRRKSAHFVRLFERHDLSFHDKSVLDVGAAEGDAAAAIHSLAPSARIELVENNPESTTLLADLTVSPAISHYGISAEEAVRVDRKHDVVLAFDLIEHLRDPATWVEDLSAHRMVSGGLLIATFPNFDSLTRRSLGPFWPQLKLEHLHYFSRAGVHAMATAAGLQTLTLRSLSKHLPVGYLLDVGSAFGPSATQALVRGLRAVTPTFLKTSALSLRLGEWVWIARKQ